MEKNKKTMKIRPYARLLTMLGDQLIKNERIALIELIKNSYDADAGWVKISFINFGENYEVYNDSKIIIEDDGKGMGREVIEKHWLNPATPEKKNRKKINSITDKGRVLQGEKGIGRFAILKLGRKIDIVSKRENDKNEFVIQYDFTMYDDDFLTESEKEKELFLDDLSVELTERVPERIVYSDIPFGTRIKKRREQGTIIEISDLKGSWSHKKVGYVYNDLAKLQSIFDKIESKETETINEKNQRYGKLHVSKDNFEIVIFKDDKMQPFYDDYIEKLSFLMQQKPVFTISKGVFNVDQNSYRFELNGIGQKLLLTDPFVKGLSVFKKVFGNEGEYLNGRRLECGNFSFDFYIFDFSAKAPAKNKLDKQDKDIIKEHRIYLYRDGIRVYPYGEPDDDWLKIDVYRGTISAGAFLSNDQIVGVVNITQKDNPNLKDKTNREGLIDEGTATDDFVGVIQIFLAYIRQKPYAQYRVNLENKNSFDNRNKKIVETDFLKLRDELKDNKKAISLLEQVEKNYKTEKKYLIKRAETTEILAGVGLSVETASHDIMSIIGKVFINLDSLIKELISYDDINRDELIKELQSIRGGVSFVEAQLKDIQLLFRSSKQRRKQIRIEDIINKVERLYKRELKRSFIDFVVTKIGSPLVVKTTDAVLLQLLLNLFDNSVYWLKQIEEKGRKIEILLDGIEGSMTFSDSGPGILKEDEPYIFEPFYSGKGEDGRGLGLYIARQLLERNDFSIDLATSKSEKILGGANFIVDFVRKE